ncbi:type VI secretion system lipoprotein TssJ [Cupriavidus basilensis]|uniref:type VI secretion system lipoprotein TssJ n=1 Tax=Cupriavidus basilensis TaxID=68895 RepID=UPI0023E7BD11|nr:type VI secretion system lipoprotein TssJ [Cupriavidus basilensis]MDF3884869.1 type VI secretion system lipoprotein TssJ [Cupriavidus basilensis]
MEVKHVTHVTYVTHLILRRVRQSTVSLGLAGMVTLLAGCGAWQSVKDTTVAATSAVFVAKVKQMNLAIVSRSALNQDERGVSLPVVLRIYQLKDAKAFETATYAQLLEGAGDPLKTDMLGRTEVTLGPAATVRLSEPMADDAQHVGVVAFFREHSNAEWQLVIPKARWKKGDPVKLAVTDNRIELEPRQ